MDQINEPKGQQTEFLLNAISTRLAGRADCRKVNYIVRIDHNGVTMDPLIYVFPNRYMRKEDDKIDIISFVHQYKMRGALLSDFVFGTYEYQMSIDGKRRKWRKLDENYKSIYNRNAQS